MYARKHIIAVSIVSAVIIAAIIVLAIMITTVVIFLDSALPSLDETPVLISSFDRIEISKWLTWIS